MSAKKCLSRLTLEIEEEDHKRLKALAAELGTSMRVLVVNWIHEHLCGVSVFTLKAIESVEKGHNLTEANDAEDLFRKLGI